MSRTLLPVLTVTALLGIPGVAHADPISFTHSLDPSIFFSRQGTETFSFIHDLGLEGFDPNTDTLDTSMLTLSFGDDNDPAAETVDITIDDALFNNRHLTSGTGSTRFAFDVETLLTPEGLLSVSLSRQNGDFWLNQSTLTASGERTAGVTPTPVGVPEPSTLVLLGIGVLGTQLVQRRRKS